VRTARRHPLRFMMATARRQGQLCAALTKTMFIAGRLRRQVGEQHMVGLLLPPSVGGALRTTR